jgi:hypothetical protein
LRLRADPTQSANRQEQLHAEWSRLLSAKVARRTQQTFTQWPPAGTTATGGWLENNWDQGSPYNNSCPLDPVTGARSVAGCPAVAMAQILNFHQDTNGTSFDDADDYYHSYDGRSYWIDDDYKAHEFPSFDQLSASLDALDIRYRDQIPITDSDRASLTFACGVAAHQVYTSSISGTFGVNQALQAYQKFSVTQAELLDEFSTDLWSRLSQNMKDALPAHLAVVNESSTAGHNVVVDGYNTDDYYHLNFGWGGAANGWYLLPSEIPYDLTVIEGVIVDIKLSRVFIDGFETGDTSAWSEAVLEPKAAPRRSQGKRIGSP